jgi:hypothetical protein
MLIDAIVKLHDKIQNMKLGVNRENEITELEQARLRQLPLLPHLQAPEVRSGKASELQVHHEAPHQQATARTETEH